MRYHIKMGSVEDFFYQFSDFCVSVEQIGNRVLYTINEPMGSGFMEHFFFDSGIEVLINHVTWNKNLSIDFAYENKNIQYYNTGTSRMFLADSGTTTFREGDFSVVSFADEGWLEFPEKQLQSSVCIRLNNTFYKGSHNEDFVREVSRLFEKREGNTLDVYKVSMALRVPFDQILLCPFRELPRFMYVESKTMEIFSILLANGCGAHPDPSITIRDEDMKRLQQARDILLRNIQNPPSVEELAQLVYLNSFKLKKGFKQVYGSPVYEYLKEQRMQKARTLLQDHRQMNISEVVNAVGYSNQGHFAKAFRGRFGFNPKDYRQLSS